MLPSYIMENIGINLTESALTTGTSSAPAVTLDRDQLEYAVSKLAAESIWLGESVPDYHCPVGGGNLHV